MPLSDFMLSILVCPQCKGNLAYDRAADTLTCSTCRLRFRVEDDVPDMMVEKAERIDPR